MSRATLLAELKAAVGYMRNAKIDLETGATKATAIRTVSGGIARAEAAIDAAERSQPADWAYLAACLDAHADKFPVPEHMRLFIQPLRDLAEGR